MIEVAPAACHDGGDAIPRLEIVALMEVLAAVAAGSPVPPGVGAIAGRAAGWVRDDAGMPAVTPVGRAALDAAAGGDLDALSALFEAYAPYAACLRVLRARRALPRDGLAPPLRRAGVRASPVAARALAAVAVGLGQAFTTLGRVVDGSRRPDGGELAAELRAAFDRHARDGLAPVSDLVADLCPRLRMAPHALGLRLGADPGVARAAGIALTPSAGGPVRSRDRVLAVGEAGFEFAPVPLDRIHLGDRPVFVAIDARGGA